MIFEEKIITSMVSGNLPEELLRLSANELSLVINEVKNVAFGGFTATSGNPAIERAAVSYMAQLTATRNMVSLLVLFCSVIPAWFALRSISKDLRARNLVEGAVRVVLFASAGVAILTTIGIVFSVLFESLRFFQAVPLTDFLFGRQWSPQIAMRADQAGSSGAFGAVPVLTGTFLVAAIAMLVAIPIGLLAAIYLSEQPGRRPFDYFWAPRSCGLYQFFWTAPLNSHCRRPGSCPHGPADHHHCRPGIA